MKKSLIVMVMILTLALMMMGCNKDQEVLNDLNQMLQKQAEEIESLNKRVDLLNEELTNQLNADVVDHHNEIQDLKNNIETLRESEHSHFSSVFDDDYTDYMITHSYDVIRAMDSYNDVYGTLAAYDSDLQTVTINRVEFIAYYDDEKIEALNVDTSNDPIEGSYIHHSKGDQITYKLSSDYRIYLTDRTNITIEQLLEDTVNADMIFRFSVIEDKIIRLTDYQFQ